MPEEDFETPQPLQTTKPKPTNWPKIVLAAVLGFGLLAGACYAGYWYGTESAKLNTQNQETPTPTPTPTVEDGTADWKIYTNAKYGYLIKYPSGWTVTEERVSQGELARQSLRTAELDFGKTAAEVTLAVVTEKPSSERLRSIGVINAGSPAVFGNVRGMLYESKGIGVGGSGYRADFVFEKDNKVFWIYLVTGLGNETLHKPTFDLMLSTFKFIEVEDGMKDWKTYRSEEYGFEFKYPQNFQVTEGLGQYFLNQKPAIELKSEIFNYLQSTIDAYLTVSVKSNAKAECEYVPRGVIDTLQNKEINGVSFTMFSTSGTATGNTYSNNILHRLKGTSCYEIVTTIHEASDGNTPDDLSKINEQKTKLENQLDQILSTFKFL